MKKIKNYVIPLSLTTLLLSGCISTSEVKVPAYNFQKSNVIMKAENNILVSNGILTLQNGERIIDSEGDIVDYFLINNNLFYITNSKNQEFIIKNKQNKIIERIIANNIKLFKDNNEVFIATKENLRSNVYENIYSFNGVKLQIINKNLNLSNGYINDKYFVNRYHYIELNLATFDILITDIRNNSLVNLNAKYNPGAKVFPIGIVNDNIYYVYGTSNFISKNVLEVFNTKTNTTSTLFIGNDNKFQLFKNNENVILKIFDNKDVKREVTLAKHLSNPKSQYEQIPAKCILLNTLKEIDGISNYQLYPILSTYKNAGGADVPETIITFDLSDLAQFARKSEVLLF